MTGDFGEVSVPKFLYGSHYSTSPARRCTTCWLNISLQNGRFDCADRMFH